MKTRSMILISAAVYSFFVICLIAVVIAYKDDINSLSLGLYVVVSGLTVSTLILAVLFVRKSPSERYEERFGDENKS